VTPRRIQSLTPNTNQKYSVTCPESQRNHKQIRHIHNKQMHQKLLTIKDTLLSSQTSHPPQQSPHKPCRNHHKATRPTLPHQPRNHKTTIPEPASRTSQPHHHQSSSPENYTSTNQITQTRSHKPARTSRNHHNHQRSQQFPAPQQDPQKPKHSSHKRQIMPPAIPPRNHQNSHQPHTHKREAENTHYTPPPPTQINKTSASSPRAYLPHRCPSRDLSSRRTPHRLTP